MLFRYDNKRLIVNIIILLFKYFFFGVCLLTTEYQFPRILLVYDGVSK